MPPRFLPLAVMMFALVAALRADDPPAGEVISQEATSALPARAGISLADIAPAASPVEPRATSELTSGQQERLRAAQTLAENGQVRAAAERIRQLREEGVTGRDLSLLAARVALQVGMTDQAYSEAREAYSFAPRDVDVNVLIAGIAVLGGDRDTALAHFRAATLGAEDDLANSNGTLAWFQLGALLEEQGYWRAAVEAFEHFDRRIHATHLEHRNAPEIEELLERMPLGAGSRRYELLVRLGDAPARLQLTEWMLRQWPENLYVGSLHADALREAGQPAAALDFCRERMTRPEAELALLNSATSAAREAGRLDEWLDECLERGRENPALVRAVLRGFKDRKADPLVMNFGRKAIERIPGELHLAMDVAAIELASDQPAAAARTIASALAAHPELELLPSDMLRRFQSLVMNMAPPDFGDGPNDRLVRALWLAAGDSPEAADAFQAAAAVEGAPPLVRLAPLQFDLLAYRWQSVLDACQALPEELRESAAGLHLRGLALVGLDRSEEAEETLRAAVQRDTRGRADFRLGLARYYQRVNETPSARRYYAETLSLDPGHDEAFERLIEISIGAGQGALARREFELSAGRAISPAARRRAGTMLEFSERGAQFTESHVEELLRQHAVHPDDHDTTRQLALALFVLAQRGDEAGFLSRHAQAAELLESLLEHGDDENARILLADVQAARLRFGEAAAALAPLVERYPNRRSLLIGLSGHLFNDFRPLEGAAVLERAARLDAPNEIYYRLEAARKLELFGRFEEALAQLEAVTDDVPERDSFELMRLRLMTRVGRAAEALDLAESPVSAAPTDVEAWPLFVSIASIANAPERVEQRAQAVLADSPDAVWAREFLISALAEQRRFDDAIRVTVDGITLATWDDVVRLRVRLGRLHAEAGRGETAINEFELLLASQALSPEQRDNVRIEYLWALYRLERYQEALDKLRDFLRQGVMPMTQARLRDLEINLFFYLDDVDAYAAAMEAQLPRNPGAGNDLGYTWVDRGLHVERADRLIRRALAHDPLNNAYLDSLGWVYYKRGDFEQARLWLERAVLLLSPFGNDDDDPVLIDHLADTLWRLDQRDEAAAFWRRAVPLFEQRLLTNPNPHDRRALAGVRAKLAALAAGEPPPVAPLADNPAPVPETAP